MYLLTVMTMGTRAQRAALETILQGLKVEVRCAPSDAARGPETIRGDTPPQVGSKDTFEAVALGQARRLASKSLHISIAKHSGLEVQALGGRPGVRSDRFAGPGATDAENNAKLLRRMAEVDPGNRAAQFRCAIAVVDPWSSVEIVVVGECEGQIADKPSGAGGFGYNALFLVDGENTTLAELPPDRQHLSHHARALVALRKPLLDLIGARFTDAQHILDNAFEAPASRRF